MKPAFIIKAISIASLLATTTAFAETTSNLSPNNGFDQSSTPQGGYQYSNAANFWVANWVFAGTAGIANNTQAWGGAASSGTVAFIQNSITVASPPSVSQTITSNATSFKVSFDLAQRGTYDIGSIDVYWDNQLIAEDITPESSNFSNHSYTINSNTPGIIHTLTFRGVATGNDASVFLDNVSIQAIYQ